MNAKNKPSRKYDGRNRSTAPKPGAKKEKPVREKASAEPTDRGSNAINWFPGHMARTRRKIQESLPQVDAVVEIVDARVPLSSRNPELDSLIGDKPRLVILSKADLADENATRQFIAYFRRQGCAALALDCKTGKGLNQFAPALRELLRDSIARWEAKGMNKTLRAMVVGIPNVGKSSFINQLNRGGKAKVEDRPGVTRISQWFVTDDGIQLLDTPGVLWPKLDDQTAAMRLVFTGAIRDQILDIEEMACALLRVLYASYADRLTERYHVESPSQDPYELLQQIGKKRGMLVSGGEVDTERAAIMLMDEYRGGKLGRITLDGLPMKED